jgi:hypothetical protein
MAGLSHWPTPMSIRLTSVPLVELAAAVPLEPLEAVTIVREVLRRVLEDELPGVPSAHVIRLSHSGELSIEGPIAANGSTVGRAAQLLETLLPPFDAHIRVPGALRLIVGRALGTLDLPPYQSLEAFADALARFGAIDPAECVRQLVASRFERPDTPVLAGEAATQRDPTITVSDIRRARRATGVPLSEISRRCQVPTHLLRQLEWGYLANWPASHVGRRLLIGYARAAGLDEELVTRTVWPLLGESVATRGGLGVDDPSSLPVVVAVPVESVSPVFATSTSLARIQPTARRRWDARRVVAALTIPALLAIGAAPAIWEHSAARREATRQTAQARQGQRAVGKTDVQTPVTKTGVAPAISRAQTEPPARRTDAASVREAEVMIASPSTTRNGVGTSGVIVRQAVYRAPHQSATKGRRPVAAKSARPPQGRRGDSRARGPRKWGVWVLEKVGVRIINTEEQ